MKEIKYTSDGRKVVVVGNLNSQERIVQEIFIVDGNEIPSGENFVVKSLHDAPVVSWKERRIADIETMYKAMTAQMQKHESALRDAQRKISNHITYAGKVLKNLSPESFDTIEMFLAGEVKYYVYSDYSGPKLIPASALQDTYEGKLRLLSIFGHDDGTLSYRLNEYYDNSGHFKVHLWPFRTIEEATAKLIDLVLVAPHLTANIVALAKLHNVTLDEEKVAAWKAAKLKNAEDAVGRAAGALGVAQRTLDSVKEEVA